MSDPTLSEPKRYRKRPIVIEAMQWNGDNEPEIQQWAGLDTFYELDDEDRENCDDPESTASLYVAANSQWLELVTGEWVIRDAKGFYPCKPDIFAATYEAVEQ